MKYKGLKRAIVMLLALTMLVTGSGLAVFAESMTETPDGSVNEAVITEIGTDAVEAAAEQVGEAAAEDARAEGEAKPEADIADEAVPEAVAEDSSEAEEQAEVQLTAEDWEADLPETISTDLREAMTEIAKSQIGDDTALYKAFANADSLEKGDASFVMFVLEYANVLGVFDAIGEDSEGKVEKDGFKVPVNADTDKWIKALKDAGLFTEISEDAIPQKGDIIFLKDGSDAKAAVVLDADENGYTVAGANNKKVEKFDTNADKALGFVSIKAVAPEAFAAEEQAEEAETAEAAENAENAEEAAENTEENAEEAVIEEENAEDAEKTDELTEEELAAKKAEEEAAAKAEAEEAAKAAEEAAKAEEAGLTEQTVDAELTSAPGVGGKLRSLFTSDNGTEISISGYMPEDATVKVYPVKVEIPGQNVLAAYDITIYTKDEDGNDVEWQPEIPLNVSIKDKSIPESASDLSIYHMENKKAEPEQIGTVSSIAKSVEFRAESFSIYVIAEDEDIRTYRFVENTTKETVDGKVVWKGEYTQLRQTLKNGDVLVKPTDPTKEGSLFTGWYEYDPDTNTTSTTQFDGWGTVSGIPTHAEGASPIKEEKILVAGFSSPKVKVTYYDQNEAIVQTQEVDTGSTISPNDKSGAGYVDYVPIQNQEGSYLLFDYWTDHPFGDKRKVTSLEAGTEISLYPVLGEAHYIYFDSNSRAINGDKASYVHSIQVAPGENPMGGSGIVPTASGYEFLGWYIKSDNDANASKYRVFNADGSLNNAGWESLKTKSGAEDLSYDPTLYAHWASEAKADYTVVIWKQNLNSDGTAVTNEYAYEESFTFEDVSTSSDVSLASDFEGMNTLSGYNKMNTAGNNNAGIARDGGSNISDNRTENPYYGFEFKRMVPENINSQKADGSVRIKPNGSTVLNVYYDRAEFTLTFTDTYTDYTYTKSNRTSDDDYYIPNGTNEYGNPAYEEVYLYYYNNRWWRTRTNVGSFIRPRYEYSDPYDGDVYTRSRYQSDITFTVNTVTKPYGVKLDDEFPVKRAGATAAYRDKVGNKEHCARWDDQTSPKIYPNVIAKLPYMPGQDVTFKYDDGNDRRLVTLRYLVETVEETDPYDETYTHNGVTKHYKEQYAFDTRYGLITKLEDVEIYEENKYSFVGITDGRQDLQFTTNGNTPNSILTVEGTTYNIFYDRETPLLTLKLNLDGEIKEGSAAEIGNYTYQNQTVNVKYEKVMTEEFLSAYKTTVIPNTEEIDGTLNGVEGKYWWYYDKACKSPVDLGNYTMPDHPITLYQGLKTSFYVEVYPDGGELGGNVNTYSTWFRLDKGEKVNPYENVSRDYIKVDSAPEDTTVETYWYDAHYADEQDKDNRYAVYQPMDPEHQNGDIYIKSPGIYSFVGWFAVPQNVSDPKTWTVPNSVAPYNFDNEVTGTVRLKAKWQLMSQFNIVYDAGQGVHAPVDSKTYREGARAIVKPSRSNPVGKQFRGWKVRGTSGPVYQPNEEIPISEESATVNNDGTMTITLEAVYDDGPYKDNYTADYIFKVGDTEYYRQTLSPGEELVTPTEPEVPDGEEYEGATFTGWYEDPACKHKFSGFGNISNPVETILYAGFAKQHTVTYYDAKKVGNEWVKGDNIIEVQRYNDGDELDTSRVIYEFDRNRYVSQWNVQNGASYTVGYRQSQTGYEVRSDLIAWPDMQDYSVLLFDSRGGTPVEPAKIPTDGSWPNRPKEPTRDGYQFLGWYTSANQAYDENGQVNPSGGTEYDFDGALPAGVTTLYAWWRPVGGKTTDEYTVIWWAQAASGDKTYEFQKSQKFLGRIGSTVDLTSQAWVSEHGFDPTSVDNLVNYYDSVSANDQSKYFEFAGADADAAAAVNIDPSEVTAVIHDDGSTVLNLRFNRKRSWIGFDTDGKGEIRYKSDVYKSDSTDTSKQYYFIEAWLGRPITDIWPAYDKEREKDTSYSKALVKVTNGEKYRNWTPQQSGTSLSIAGTLQVIVTSQMLDKAVNSLGDKDNVLVYKLVTSNDSKTVHFHYFKDGIEDISLAQEVNDDRVSSGTNYPSPDNNKYKYNTTYAAKSLDGYSLITDRDKRNPSETQYDGKYAGYDYLDGSNGRPQYVVGAVETKIKQYSYTRKYTNRHYYSRDFIPFTTIAVYTELEVVIGGSGNQYDVGLTENGNPYSGTVYYRDGNSGSYQSMSMDQFKRQEFNEVVTEKTITIDDPNHVNLFFFYERNTYEVVLMNYDGTSEKERINVPYGELVSEYLVGHDPITAPANGKSFTGWSVSPDTYEPFTSFMPSRPITLYQIWDDTKVKVTTQGYNQDGNPVAEGDMPGVYEAKYNSLLRDFGVRDPNAAFPGYTFGGWEKEVVEGGETKWIPIPLSERITSDTLIKPAWNNVQAANVTYVLNGGTGSVEGTEPVKDTENHNIEGHFIDSKSYLLGSRAVIKSGANLTKTEGTGDAAADYRFACWNTKADGSGEDYYAGDTIALSKHGITLYARYVAKRKVTLIYDLNTTDTNAKFYDFNASTNKYAVAGNQSKQYLLTDSGDSTTAAGKINKVYEAGKEINDSKTDQTTLVKFLPVRPGYNFKGWSKTSSGDIDVEDGAKIRVNTLENKDAESTETLYAVWEPDRLPIEVYEYEDDDIAHASPKNMHKVEGQNEFMEGYHLTSMTDDPQNPDDVESAYRNQAHYTLTDGFNYEKALIGEYEIDKLQYVLNSDGSDYEWQYHIKGATDEEDEFKAVGEVAIKVYFNKKNSGDLTVTKQVTGEYANLLQEFTFTLEITGGNANTEYDIVISSGTTPVSTGKIKNGETFKLKNGQNAKITLPQKKKITITEAQEAGYTSTFTLGQTGTSDEGDVKAGEGESQIAVGKMLKLTSETGSLTVTNNFDSNQIVPTGIAKNNSILIPLFLILVLVLGVVMSIIYRRRQASKWTR